MSLRTSFALRSLLLYFIALCVWISVTSSTGCCSTTAPQMLETFRKNILKRRTRGVIFPKKAQVLITPSFSKGILGGIPRGLVYSTEFDMYHSLPDTVEGWKPTILLNQIEKEKQEERSQQVMDMIKAPSESSYSDGDKSQNGYNYEHSYEMVDNNFYQFPFDEYEANSNSWDFGQSEIDNEPPYLGRNGVKTHINTLARNFHSRPYLGENFPSNSNVNGEYNGPMASAVRSKLFTDSVETVPSWYDNQNYRERRQIFDQLETVGTIFNINVKACIMRAMCEISTHLKPYGESLMDDIIRITLTVPVPNGLSNSHVNDDYTHRYDGVNCANRFAVSCPYRIMQILTQNLRSKMT